MARTRLFNLLAATLITAALAPGCGGEMSDIQGSGENPPFGGRMIKFQSTYAYFPTDTSMSIVRDTIPQDEVCGLLTMYQGRMPPLRGLPVLPYKAPHYALVITVDSVMAPDEVSVDPKDTGVAGDMRYSALGYYEVGKSMDPSFAVRASGIVRIDALTQYQRIAGSFRLSFPGGETIAEPFDVSACPKNP